MKPEPYWKRAWRWVKKQDEIPVQPGSTSSARNNAGGVDPAAGSRVLLTRRLSVAEAESARELPGFPEIYFCTKCKDYFVLGWHSQTSPLVEQCEVVPRPDQVTDSDPGGVFCPKCNSDYSLYGKIPAPDVAVARPEDARIHDTFDYIFPEGASTTAHQIKFGQFDVERMVLFVTGEFPEAMDVREFAYAGLNTMVLEQCGDEIHRPEQGGIPFHLLRVSEIVDETYWLDPILKRAFYHSGESRARVFATHGVVNLQPPLRQALLCLVLSS